MNAKAAKKRKRPQKVIPENQLSLLEPDRTPAEALRHHTKAVRIRYMQMGQQRQVSKAVRTQAAQQFEAASDAISMSKKLVDPKHPAIKAVMTQKAKIKAYVELHTLPYVEDGLRLIREDEITEFLKEFRRLRRVFLDKVRDLSAAMEDVKAQARERLGDLYNENDYTDPEHSFDVLIDFPNVDPPDYLKKLDPKLYEEQYRRMVNDFQATTQLCQTQFVKFFERAVTQLQESLQGVKDGKKKCFRDSNANNLFEVMEMWQTKLQPFGIGQGSEIAKMLSQTKEIIRGYDRTTLAKNLRENAVMRDSVLQNLSKVGDTLTQMVEALPQRRVFKASELKGDS